MIALEELEDLNFSHLNHLVKELDPLKSNLCSFCKITCFSINPYKSWDYKSPLPVKRRLSHPRPTPRWSLDPGSMLSTWTLFGLLGRTLGGSWVIWISGYLYTDRTYTFFTGWLGPFFWGTFQPGGPVVSFELLSEEVGGVINWWFLNEWWSDICCCQTSTASMDMGSPILGDASITLTTSCGQALKREVDDLQKGRLPIQRSRCPKVFERLCAREISIWRLILVFALLLICVMNLVQPH